jgi:putative ubiquitin-RnfH superfamily antitoxin RatB of RatAB toxin-antitoxin module
MRVQVAYSPGERETETLWLQLPEGATLADALRLSGLAGRCLESHPEGWVAGIWTRAVPLDTPLRDQDRVELWRPLKVDPKEARRQRYRKQSGMGKRQVRSAVTEAQPPVNGSSG